MPLAGLVKAVALTHLASVAAAARSASRASPFFASFSCRHPAPRAQLSHNAAPPSVLLYKLSASQTYVVNPHWKRPLKAAPPCSHRTSRCDSRGRMSKTTSFFTNEAAKILSDVVVEGIAPPSDDYSASYEEKSYEEQTAALRRQLERLRASAAENGEEWEEGSGDDNGESDEDDGGDDSEDAPMQQGHILYFKSPIGDDMQWCSVYRDVLPSRGEGVGPAVVQQELVSLVDSTSKWAIFMIAGGHFAAAIINMGKIEQHKTFHRYVVRAKRGTVQSVRDAKSGTSQPKSAGSNLRRYNEQQLRDDISGLMASWASDIAACDLIFHRTSVHNRSFLFQSAKQLKKIGTKDESSLLVYNDSRVRSIPFPTQRPTMKEIARIYAVLTSVSVLEGEPEYVIEHRRALEQQHKREAKAEQERLEKEKKRQQHQQHQQNSSDAVLEKTDLFSACLKGDLAKVQRMLDRNSPDYGATVLDIDTLCGKFQETPLHAAAKKGFPDIVAHLLEHDADPTIPNSKKKPPYAISKGKDVRDAFRRHMHTAPEQWDYKLAQIPSPLSPEAEAAKEEKRQEKLQKEKEKKKEKRMEKRRKEKEALERERQQKEREAEAEKANKKTAESRKVKMTDAGRARQLRAEAALNRLKQAQPEAVSANHCTYCLKDLTPLGNGFFKRLDFKYCSMHCLKTHKMSLQSK